MLSLKGFSSLICIILISTKSYLVQGKYVFWPTIQRSIAQYKVISTWDYAKYHCDNQGAMLASPIDAGLIKQMKKIIGVNNYTTPYFIGIKAGRDGEFVSEEGILLEDIAEAAIYMIDQIDPRLGDCLCMDKHSIRVVSCLSRLPYMCYKNATAVSKNAHSTGASTAAVTQTSTTVPNHLSRVQIYSSKPLGNCSEDYRSEYLFYDNRRCYKLHKYQMGTWHQTCNDEGGYLAVINDSAEARLIKDICFSDNNPEFVWIGLHDMTGNRDWESVLGDNLHTIYNTGDLKNSKFDCGAMKYAGSVHDIRCDDQKSFICEKPFGK
ncbi:unnamed protein product [Arctia plantaginis]|uniref:C-type lectin domain-containing protein n=1 Tax=Arctia plantaginis TaxID=874455 RepID=A0A8S0ZWP0_ARCPL|nr:unnamed protein product [Arctia plantaginis]